MNFYFYSISFQFLLLSGSFFFWNECEIKICISASSIISMFQYSYLIKNVISFSFIYSSLYFIGFYKFFNIPFPCIHDKGKPFYMFVSNTSFIFLFFLPPYTLTFCFLLQINFLFIFIFPMKTLDGIQWIFFRSFPFPVSFLPGSSFSFPLQIMENKDILSKFKFLLKKFFPFLNFVFTSSSTLYSLCFY